MDLRQLISGNQSIKIVPSVEESLKSLGLNTELDTHIQLWFQQLKVTWNTWKKSTGIERNIEYFFKSHSDIFRLALVFVIKCDEFKECKPKTLPYLIIEILQKLSITQGIYPDDSLKLPAFHIALQQRSKSFLTLLLKTYQVITIKETIVDIVKGMIKKDNCKQASQIVIAMDLFNEIPVEDLMFPLILQDKVIMIDDYLSECPEQVKPFIHFLDNLLDKKINAREFAEKFVEENNISHVNYEKIRHKPLGKLIARLCKKFNMSIEACTNLSRNRTTCGLRYLIYKKYIEHNVSSSEWDDLIKDSLRQNAESAHEFIDALVDYDTKEALKWARYLNIDENYLPLALKEASINDNNTVEENWDDETNKQEFYRLNLPDDHIKIIDDVDKFYDMMISNLPPASIVSIDCEWKPSFGAKQLQVALIQIATSNYVYLIDACVLNKQTCLSFWNKFNKALLGNPEIIKVGFGLEQDLKEIKASIIGLGNINVKGEGLLDMSSLWKSLINSGLKIDNKSEISGNSLSSLVECCFGLPLQKSEQCSNWELRPLRDTQLHYAALDAFVLIELYYYLKNLCLDQGIDFDEICSEIMLETKKKSIKKPKVADTIQSSVLPDNHERTETQCVKFVSDVKFIVESQISNLVPYLRYCGIDTEISSCTMPWQDVINKAISEERLILTYKQKISPFPHYPQRSILYVPKKNVKQQLQTVFKNYNIVVKHEDINKRCIYCNEICLKNLSQEEVIKLSKEYQSSDQVATHVTNIADYEEEDIYYDSYDGSDYEDEVYHPVIPEKNPQCVTSRGVQITIHNLQTILLYPTSADLCESCGILYCDDDLLKSITETVMSIIHNDK